MRRVGKLCGLHFLVAIFGLASLAKADPPAGSGATECMFYFPDQSLGVCRAVSVTAARDLVHTAQILPLDQTGTIVGRGDAKEQVRKVFDNLAEVLTDARSDVSQVVKLNAYVRDASVSSEVYGRLAEMYHGNAKPAVTFVATRLQNPDAMVAVDAVAIVPGSATDKARFGQSRKYAPSSASSFGILAAGPRVYISGQAEKGDGTLADGTTKTLESLVKSLKYCGLERDNIVQLKGFMAPMSDAPAVEKAVAKFFDGATAPPLILVEWKAGSLPIEIELVASSPKVQNRPTVEYLTPPELKKSPVYSRIVRVNSPRVVYISGLVARKEGQSGAEEVRAMFPILDETLKAAGSDLEHMVKATYYVADAEVSAELNKVRPEYYNPDRPPAASKAEVTGIGLRGHRVTMDMIAVPK